MLVNLILQKKDGTFKTFRLPSTVTIVGRRRESDLCIPLMVVSRKHCEFNCDENLLKVRDLGSRNGTYVNGERIETETILSPGDKVRIGPLSFLTQIDGRPADVSVSDSKILPAQSTQASSEMAAEFLAASDDLDLNQTYSSSQIMNSMNDKAAKE